MPDRIKGITVEIGGDTTKLSKALEGVNKSVRSTQSQLRDVQRLLKLDPTNTDLIAQKQRLLGNAVSDTKGKLSQLKAVQDQMDAGLRNGSVTQKQYDAWQREIVATEQELKKLEKEVRNTDSAISATLKQAGSKVQSAGEKISSAGSALTKGVTLPLGALGAASFAAFNEVDAGLDIVEQKTGATGDALESMYDTVKDLATEIPTDFETAGSAVGEVSTRFGVTGEKLKDLSSKFIRFADLNSTDVSSSVDSVSSVMNAFGMKTSQAGDLLDALNATGQATGIDMNTLASSLSSNAAQLKEMGLTAQQAAGFMGTVEMSGLDTSAAMMGLKTAMKNATKDGKSLDTALSDFSQTMKSNKSDADKLQAAYDLFGSKAGASIYNAVETGKLSLTDLSDSMSGFSGSVEKTFTETLDPIDRFKTTLNSLKEAGAEIGSSLATILAPVLDKVSSALKTFSENWNALPESVRQNIIKFAGIAAALGPVLSVFGKLTGGAGKLMQSLGNMPSLVSKIGGGFKTAIGGISAPVVAVVAVIGTLIAAFTHLWNTNSEFKNNITATWEGIKAKFTEFSQGLVERINSLGFNFKSITDVIRAAWDGLCNWLAPVFQTAFSLIGEILGNALDVILGIVDVFTNLFRGNWSGVWEGVKEIFAGVWNAITSLLEGAFSLICNIFGTDLETVKSFWTDVWTSVKDFFTNIWTNISGFVTTVCTSISTFFTNIWTGIKSFFTGIWDSIKNTVTERLNLIKAVITTVWNAVSGFISNVLNSIKSTVSGIWNGIKDTISGVMNTIKTTVSSIWDSIRTAVSGKINGIKTAISDGFGKAVSFIKNLASEAWNWGSDIITGIVDGIKSCVGKVGEAAKSVAEKIRSFLHFSVPDEGPLAGYESWMPDFMKGLASGIEKSRGLVRDAMGDVSADMVLSPKIPTVTAEQAGSEKQSISTELLNTLKEALSERNVSGDIVIPVYIGGSMLDEIVINAQRRADLRSGGR